MNVIFICDRRPAVSDGTMGRTMMRLATLLTVLLIAQVSPVWAQCQTLALPFGSQQTGTIDATDCSPVASFSMTVRGPGEYWTLQASAVPPGIYYVRVRAVNAQGAGAQSNEVRVAVF